MTELDLACVASFLALVDERHYGRAAAKLHITASALNKRIHRLESALGVTLLERGCYSPTEVTPGGKWFAQQARPMLEDARSIKRAMNPGTGKWVVRLGVPGPLGYCPPANLLQQIMKVLRHSFPDIRLSVIGLPLHSTVSSLLDGAVDVLWTVQGSPVGALVYSNLALAARSMFVPNEHPLSDAESIDPETACAVPILRNPGLPAEWMDPFTLADISRTTSRRIVDTAQSGPGSITREVLRAGIGVVGPSGYGNRVASRLSEVQIVGAQPIWYVGARRRNDRRSTVDATLQCMGTVARLGS